jgi:hypothetical protein
MPLAIVFDANRKVFFSISDAVLLYESQIVCCRAMVMLMVRIASYLPHPAPLLFPPKNPPIPTIADIAPFLCHLLTNRRRISWLASHNPPIWPQRHHRKLEIGHQPPAWTRKKPACPEATIALEKSVPRNENLWGPRFCNGYAEDPAVSTVNKTPEAA